MGPADDDGRNSVLPENRRLPGAGNPVPVPAAAAASAGTKRKTSPKAETTSNKSKAKSPMKKKTETPSKPADAKNLAAKSGEGESSTAAKKSTPSKSSAAATKSATTTKSSRSKVYQLLGKESDTKSMCKKLNELCKSDVLSENSLREVIERYGWTNNNQLIHSYVFFSNACHNEKATEGLLRCLLEYFPRAPRIAQGGRTPLHVICGNKNVTVGMVQLLIDAHPEYLRRANNGGEMTLHALCLNRNLNEDVGLEILNYLIERCPESVRHADNGGSLPIHIAATCQSPEFCRILVEAYPGSERMASHDGSLPFHRACHGNNVATANYFFELHPESTSAALLKELSAFCQSKSLSEDALRTMIERYGCAPKSNLRIDYDYDYDNYAFFLGACKNRRVTEGILRYLLEYFPDAVRAIGEKGRLPIHNICHNKNITLGMVQLLIDAYPESLRRADNMGYMPLRLLCGNKEIDEDVGLDILKHFIQRCPESVRHTTEIGSLPIHCAAMNQSPEFCRMLIDAYPEWERVTVGNHGPLPIHWACQWNTVATVKYFYQLYPESISMADNGGSQPIHCSIWGLKYRKRDPKLAIEVIKFLLDCNVNVASQKYQDKFPLYWVCKRATNDNSPVLNAYLEILQLLYDAYPEAIDEVTSDVGRFCQEVQTFINTQLTTELLALCRSDSLSEDGLWEIIERYGAPKKQNITSYLFFRKVCRNESVTEGILSCLLKYFPDAASYISERGLTPLHKMCYNKNVTLGMVQLLIDAYPESLSRANNNGWMPLHYLCGNKEIEEEAGLEILKLLLEELPESVRHTTGKGNLPLHLASETRSPEFCRILIEAYPGSERMTNCEGALPFHVACGNNTLATVKYFYKLYPEGNVAGTGGICPIHRAVWGLKGRSDPSDGIEVIQFLMDIDPDDLVSALGQTPLHIAFGHQNQEITLEIVQLLIDVYPDSLRHVDNINQLPLHLLCHNKYLDEDVGLEILKFLLEKYPGAVRHAAGNGVLPLHFAAPNQSLDFCRILIDAYPGSERMTNGDDGSLPFHWACGYSTLATVKYLLQLYPESISMADNNGKYPLHYVIWGLTCREDNPGAAVEVVKFLLDYNANVALQKYRDKFPLYWVCRGANSENTPMLNAYLKILHLLYGADPDAIYMIVSNVGTFCPEVQTFITTQLKYARQARDHTLLTTPDESGQLPLHRALRDNVILGSIKLLVKGNPFAIRCADNTGMIPLHVACQHHDSPSVVEYLVGLNPMTLEVNDLWQNTVLHFACRSANYTMIRLLLEKYSAASVSKRNFYGQLPIDLLFESEAVNDREDVEYTASIYRLIRAHPETLMG